MNMAPFVESRKLIQDARIAGNRFVFKAIQENSSLTFEDLAHWTMLGQNVLTPILLDLMSNGLIDEYGGTDNGFNSKTFIVKGDAHLVAGITMTDKMASFVFLDFAGNQFGEYIVTPPKPVQDPDAAVEFIKSSLEAGLKKYGRTISELSAICLGLPGLIDAEKGIVHWSPGLSKRNLGFEKLLRDEIGTDVFIDNDANLVAKAECRYGPGKDLKNFIVVTIEEGVGLGIIVNGEIYRGTNGRGAELGHIKVQIDGALCRCGQRGCMEAYVGDYALLHEARMALDIDPDLTNEEQMKVLLAASDEGHVQARNILMRSGRMLTMSLASLINILAPELIIMLTKRMEGNSIYLDAVVEELSTAVTQLGGPPPDVVLHKWEDHMWALGAATVAVERVADATIKNLSERTP